MSQGIYLFCLTPENPLLEITGTGFDETHPLYTEAMTGVIAILAAVSLDDFCGPAAREKLADLAWVAPRALRHEEVIVTIMHQAPVLPVRFGSVFSSLSALTAALERHRAAVAQFFHDTAGQKEWTLKAFVNRPQAKARLLTARLTAESEQCAGLAPGKRYFLEQKIKGAVDREVTSWLKEIANEIFLSFNEVASATCESRLLTPELTGRDDEMFFHAALLVPDHAVARLQCLTVEWNATHEVPGFHLESSGPWPPYHFTPVLDPQG